MEKPRETVAVKTEITRSLWLIFLAIGIASLMSSLDSSVVNIILPVIKADFVTDVATIEWVVVVYLLVVSSLLLTFGRLGDLRGHKSVFVFGFGLFILGSALCGLALSAVWLVVFRGFQAVGGAILLSNATPILTRNFPAAMRGRVLGLQGTMIYLGLTVGPSLGGWLTHQFNWRSVFYINLPIGLLGFLLSIFFIPADLPGENHEAFDLAGGLVFMAGLVALMLGLNQGSSWGWFSPLTLGLLSGALILLGAFWVLESRTAHPMLDLSLFYKRVFTAGITSAVLNYICLYSVIFLMPFYLLQARGMNTMQAGALLTAQPLIMAIAAPLSGTLSDRIGSRVLATLGMLIMAVGLFMLSRLGPDTGMLYIILSLAVTGLGTGIFVSPNTSAVMGSAPRHRQGVAAGVLATARNVGMVLGVGLAGAIMTTLLDNTVSASFFGVIAVGFSTAAVLAVLGGITAALRGSEVKPS
jgi:EmrB/QacA subfamily drug resistance transporter